MSESHAIRRVLQVHTRYRQAGGEDQVVEAERALLEDAGISVRQVLFDNGDLREARSLPADAVLAASAVWNTRAARRVAAAVRDHRPDAIHVHNTFAAASPAVYRAAGQPVVQTVHNYRFVCPAATAFRAGAPCIDCAGRAVPWPALKHRCVRGSAAQSAVAGATLAIHRSIRTFDRIGAYVTLTAFQGNLLVDAGLPADRIRVIPNFLEPDPGVEQAPRHGMLYLGRLAEEKGIATLLAAAGQAPGLLRVAGSGPLAQAVADAASRGEVAALGRLEAPAALEQLRTAAALVVPSIWFEGFPLVVLEAYATGTPVIASRIGSLAEVVEDGVTGLLTRPGDPDDLARQLRWAMDHAAEMERMGAAARARYEARFRGRGHLDALLAVYAEVRERRTATAQRPATVA